MGSLIHSFPVHLFSTPPPLNTSENRKIFWCFQGVEEGCIGKEWVNPFHSNASLVILYFITDIILSVNKKDSFSLIANILEKCSEVEIQ